MLDQSIWLGSGVIVEVNEEKIFSGIKDRVQATLASSLANIRTQRLKTNSKN